MLDINTDKEIKQIGKLVTIFSKSLFAVHSSLKKQVQCEDLPWKQMGRDIAWHWKYINNSNITVEMSRDGTHLIVSTLNMYYKAGGGSEVRERQRTQSEVEWDMGREWMRPDRKRPERCLYEGNEEWLLIRVIGGKGDFPDEAQLQTGWPTYMKWFYFHGKIFFFKIWFSIFGTANTSDNFIILWSP